MAAIGWCAEEPETVVVVVREGVQEAEADRAADVGYDLACREVADTGVRMVGVLREPDACVIQVVAADVLEDVCLVGPPA